MPQVGLTPTTFAWFPACWDGLFLSFKVILVYQQVLSESSSFQGYNPWDSSKQISKEMYRLVLVAVNVNNDFFP